MKLDACRYGDGLLFRLNSDETGYIFYGTIGSGNLEIPETFEGLPVVACGNRGDGWNFIPVCGCAETEKVTFPDTLREICDSAFRYCGALKEIVLPDSVTTVGNYAFSGCRKAARLVVGKGVKSVGRSAFSGCTVLQEVEFSAGNLSAAGSLSYSVFKDCNLLSSVIFGKGVKNIPDYLLYGCGKLSKIDLPDGLKFIGEYSFCGCRSLKSLTLPSEIECIGWGAFRNCTALRAVNFAGTLAQWKKVKKYGWDYDFDVVCLDGKISGES